MKKRLIGTLLVGTALTLALAAGAGKALAEWVRDMEIDENLITSALRLELGSPPEEEKTETEAADVPGEQESVTTEKKERVKTVPVVVAPPPAPTESESGPEMKILTAELSADVDIYNDTSIDVDLKSLAEEEFGLALDRDEPQILIIHTHSSEAYAQDPYDRYEESDESRTEDKRYSVIRVGDELTEKLGECGLNVIHDRDIYDYPSYTGSYNRSGEAVMSYIDKYPSIKIVIDLHRDAIGTGDVIYKTKAELNGRSCAQVMLLVGTGENGLAHPDWRENLKLAVYMQNAMDERYPTLARPIALKKERYNQHLTKGSLILEVGSSGNTLEEALTAIDLFGETVGPALAKLVD